MDRRTFLGYGALAAAAGVTGSAKAANLVSTVKTAGGRTRQFVAACPPSSREYGRAPTEDDLRTLLG
ncbi:MAG: twin-arginine translocation signal domain-containing protein [Kiritimatiellae bacterium]|nr:twin-arginine translocation signal domain-containing protein [Kiritimatiellia bacterium]